jgi:twitching motility protein PilT
MIRLDFYVQQLVRHQAEAVELSSGKPVRFSFAKGDKQSKSPLEHAQLVEIVKEAAPGRVMEQLERDKRARFSHGSSEGEVTVEVTVHGGSEWTVRVTQGAAPPDDIISIDLGPPPKDAPIDRPIGGVVDGGGEAVMMRMTPRVQQSVRAPRVEPVSGEPAINRFLRMMTKAGASDLHLSSGVVPMWRLHGEMQQLEGFPVFEPEELGRVLREILPDKNRAEFDEGWDTDFGHAIEGVARFRANYFVDRRGPGAVFRQIPLEILNWKELGLPQSVLDLCWLSKGLVVVTGPTGSGKSTTLAALIDFINDNRTDHLITIEDPIEFVHKNKKCLVNQREVGTHTKTFKAALRAALREDPDIVLVGEMRDLETIAIAIETAETGHLVFGTLHTTSAKSTIDRIIDQFPADRQEQVRVMLSESLRGVVAQVLCKKKGGGRVAAHEILIGTPAVANLIREGKTFQITSVMQTGRNVGMQTMTDHLIALVQKDLVEPEEAYIQSNDKSSIREAFKKSGIQLRI